MAAGAKRGLRPRLKPGEADGKLTSHALAIVARGKTSFGRAYLGKPTFDATQSRGGHLLLLKGIHPRYPSYGKAQVNGFGFLTGRGEAVLYLLPELFQVFSQYADLLGGEIVLQMVVAHAVVEYVSESDDASYPQADSSRRLSS